VKLEIKGNRIYGANEAIHLRYGERDEVEIGENLFVDTKKVLDAAPVAKPPEPLEPKDILRALGVPEDVDPKVVSEVIQQLVEARNETEKQQAMIKESSLYRRLLSLNADVATVATTLVNVANHPAAQNFIKNLLG